MRLVVKAVDRMRCFRRRGTLPALVLLIALLLFLNLYLDPQDVLEAEKRPLDETLPPPAPWGPSAPGLREPANFSGGINVTYRYLAGLPLNRKKFLTIGLSSVKRRRGGYLVETLRSVFDQSSYEELQQMVVVVHLADFDRAWCDRLVGEISRRFAHHLQAGRLLVVQAPRGYYPPLDGLKRNFDDPEGRVRFRSKQNVDYAFLLHFCAGLSDFYVMLEDDVRCARNFLSALRKVVWSRQGSDWATLEFSKLGYIGKLYRSGELPRLARFLLLFYQEMPCDWLLLHFRRLLAQRDPLRFRPSLFQHVGRYSSYDGAENKLRDDDFLEEDGGEGEGAPAAAAAAAAATADALPDNPPARCHTSLRVFERYGAGRAYSSVPDDYFWGKPPAAGDFLLVVLDEPAVVSRVRVVTGTEERRGDVLRRGALEVGRGPAREGAPGRGRQCASYVTLGEFREGRVEVRDVHRRVGFPVQCLRVVVTAGQQDWLIVRTVAVWTAAPPPP